jgi:hypothetical protein
MPIETTQVVNITCDNPDCPMESGLDPHDRTGWFFITSEYYGSESRQSVFCCDTCAAAGATNPDVEFANPSPGLPATPVSEPAP